VLLFHKCKLNKPLPFFTDKEMLAALYLFRSHDVSQFVLWLTSWLLVINSGSSFQIYDKTGFDDFKSLSTLGRRTSHAMVAPSILSLDVNFFAAVVTPILATAAGMVGGKALPMLPVAQDEETKDVVLVYPSMYQNFFGFPTQSTAKLTTTLRFLVHNMRIVEYQFGTNASTPLLTGFDWMTRFMIQTVKSTSRHFYLTNYFVT
jgi:hypothetical protein